MYTAGAQHRSSRLSLWRPAPQEKLLLCVNVAAPEKRSRPAHGWKGRPRSCQRSARWYQAFFFFVAGTSRSLVPHTKTKTIFPHQNQETEPQLQVITSGWCVAKKKGTYRGHHLRWRKKERKKRRGAEYGYRTRELRLDSLMVSPPTPQRH